MKRVISPVALISFVLLSSMAIASPFAQDSVKTNDQGKISITSKGKDVREVLYDLFVQKKKNFVIEGVEKIELYLNLNDISFDEALEIVMKQAGLKYDLQNDIYYLAKKTAPVPPVTNPATDNGKIPVKDPVPIPVPGVTGSKPSMTPIENRIDPPKPVTLTAPKPTQVSEADLRKRLTTRFNLIDIRELFADFSRQTGVKIEIADDVPAYKVKAFLIDTSLKFALDTVTKKAKLKYTRTDNQTLLVTKA